MFCLWERMSLPEFVLVPHFLEKLNVFGGSTSKIKVGSCFGGTISITICCIMIKTQSYHQATWEYHFWGRCSRSFGTLIFFDARMITLIPNATSTIYGDGVGLYKTHLFRSPTIIAWTPSTNKFVLQNGSSFSHGSSEVELAGTTSLVAVEGAEHKRLRGLVANATNQPDVLRKITLMVQPNMVNALKSWARKGRIIAYKETRKVTLENIGKYFASLEPGHVMDTLDELYEGLLNGFRAYPLNFPGMAYYHALQCRKKANAIFKEEMDKRKKSESPTAKYDLIEGLMHLKDDNGNKLSDSEVLDNITIFVIAGYASTSLAIMWALYYLAAYPKVLAKLREEHMEISKKMNGDFITYDQILSCKYTSNVVDEIIRLANVSAFIFRTALEDVEYKGCRIPKGWKVICWLRYVHTNPEIFDDPMLFNPDRWNEAMKPGTNLVFGGGHRVCPGNMLAKLQVAIIIHHLCLGYRWNLVNPNAGISYLPFRKPVDDVEIDISEI